MRGMWKLKLKENYGGFSRLENQYSIFHTLPPISIHITPPLHFSPLFISSIAFLTITCLHFILNHNSLSPQHVDTAVENSIRYIEKLLGTTGQGHGYRVSTHTQHSMYIHSFCLFLSMCLTLILAQAHTHTHSLSHTHTYANAHKRVLTYILTRNLNLLSSPLCHSLLLISFSLLYLFLTFPFSLLSSSLLTSPYLSSSHFSSSHFSSPFFSRC